MQIVNIHEAKTHLSRLVEDAALGKVFIIAKAGKPMVKVTPLTVNESQKISKLGFMSGEIAVPDDFDAIESGQISDLFEGRVS